MSTPDENIQSLPKQLPMLAVLGLNDEGTEDWARLRGLQYASLAVNSRRRIVGHGIAAAAAGLIFLGKIHPLEILGWAVILATALYFSNKSDMSLADADRRKMTQAEITRQSQSSAITALAWVIPVGTMVLLGDRMGLLELWTVLALIMAVSAISLPAVPMSTVLFIGIVGGAAVVSFLFMGAWNMAVVALLYEGAMAMGAIRSARYFLVAGVAEAAMAEKTEVVSLLLREFEEGEADWLWQTDTSRRVRSASPRFAFAVGIDTNELEGQPFIQLIAGVAWETGQFPASLHDLAERLKRRENFSNLLVRVTIKGEQRWWELSGTPKLDDNGNFDGFRGVGSDVTEQRESSDKIAHMARYDTLTGLPNRMMVTEALGEAMRYAQQWRTRCAFMMIDLDRFKAVNDTLGHLVGDQLLAQVSARLKEQMSENELCGRLGGDEFAIVVRDASDLDRTKHVAQRVISHLSQPYQIDHHTLYVGASIGSAFAPRDGKDAETLMRNADLALYRAKDEGGGNHFMYEPSLHADAEERRKLEFSLRQALEKDELLLHYQPVVNANSEELVSFEALVRWNSAEHGFISPAKFIPLAEDTRLIVPIGEWVMRQACIEASNWPENIKVAVNVSGEQLLEANFVQCVIQALQSSGLPPQRLEIEVTESIFVRDATQARKALEAVMALGCSVALDDFGTGYSSLGYLRTLRFSTIKVDRSFVQGAATGNAESLAIIRAVVAMAESLEMSTTAEGVETEAELELIRKLGCNKIQGYYFGRPMPALDARRLFKQRAHIRGNAA